MKNLFFILLVSIGIFTQAQSAEIEGAYLSQKGDVHQLWLFVDGYSSLTEFKANEFISTMGGPYQAQNNQLIISVEFNDKDSSEVGNQLVFPLKFNGDDFTDSEGNKWVKQIKSQDLDGAWKITGRKIDGEMKEIHQRGERKTLKLLVGGYFQWFAIDPSQKSFSGTGGGIYTFEGGKYTEKIQFFSRDNSRVGTSLQFDGELKDGKWHHSGLSSKGDPIYEIWGRIN